MIHFQKTIALMVLWAVAWFFMGAPAAAEPPEPICLYVSSYHPGYHWNDGIEEGLTRELSGVCRLEKFYMDTKRNRGADFAAAKGKEAKELIDRIHPDVVIAADDNASKYLVMPYLKDADVPVVFCGVNWTVSEYGYPYSNVTGMIEVAPNRQVVRQALEILGRAKRFAFVTADVPTQHKEIARLEKVAAREGLELQSFPVKTLDHWRDAFLKAQAFDFVVLGNPVGISDWDAAAAKAFVMDHTRRLSTGFGLYMKPYAVFSMVNTPVEHGEWSGKVAKLLIQGHVPSSIPIITNRRWEVFVNPTLAGKAGITLPTNLLEKAIRID